MQEYGDSNDWYSQKLYLATKIAPLVYAVDRRLDELEGRYDSQFKMVFDAIREMMDKPEPSKKRIGFTAKERRAKYAKK